MTGLFFAGQQRVFEKRAGVYVEVPREQMDEFKQNLASEQFSLYTNCAVSHDVCGMPTGKYVESQRTLNQMTGQAPKASS